jgi:anti-anti-sigma regulatory factor/HAMP domain-containing protein
MRITVSQRFGLGFLLVITLLILSMAITTGVVDTYRANSLTLATRILPEMTTADRLATNVNLMINATLRFVLTGNPLDLQARATAVGETDRLIDSLQRAAAPDREQDTMTAENLAQLAAAVESVQTRTERFVKARQDGSPLPIGRVLSQLDAEQVRFSIALTGLNSVFETKRVTAVAAAKSNPLLLPWFVCGVILLVCLGWFILLVRTVVHPLRTLHDATIIVAGGDLKHQVPVSGNHELGDLARAFNQMVSVVADQQGELQRQISLAETARSEAEAARQTVVAQLAQIEIQQHTISEMSIPVLPVDTATLVMPLIGSLGHERLQLAQAQALQSVEQAHVSHLVVDITGVPVVDTLVAQGLIQLVRATRLLGTTTVLVGVRPEVAQTIVGLGLHFDEIVTMGTLREGIAYAQRHSAGMGKLLPTP